MKKNRIFNILLLVVSITLLVGCGGGGGSGDNSGGGYNPVTPDNDLPTEFNTLPAFNKEPNVIYTQTCNSSNVAIDLPVGSTYFVTIRNTAPNTQNISLVSSVTANIRASVTDEPQQIILANFTDSFIQQDRAEIEMQYRMNFINRLRNRNNSNVLRSARAGISGVDHSYEKVGSCYDIYTCDLNGNTYCLNNCKLVAETAHAKFFVDQNTRGGYKPYKDMMESFVTDGDFALTKVFDGDTVNIYNLMSEKFGTFHDIDNDGKVSVIITPYLSVLSSSLLGLFMHDTMLESFPDPRDHILLAPPINGVNSNKHKHEAVTNLCHEYQHLINFSQRFYRNGKYSFNDDDSEKYNYELFFDEGSSVCAEALFRRARGGDNSEHRTYPSLYDYKTGSMNNVEYTGNDERFNNIFLSTDGCFKNVFPFYDPNTDGINNTRYKKYGLNGLFFLFLHDRFGSEKFKKLIELPFTGNDLKTVIPQTLGSSESLDELQRDWHLAMQHQYLLTEQNGVDSTNARFKYNDWLKLESHNKQINSSRSISLEKGFTALYKLTPSQANSGKNFRFFIKSSGYSTYKNLEINIIKL